MKHWVLDERGEPAEAEWLEWVAWYEKADRTVARDEIDHYTVSTVFLGLDHSFVPGGPPVLWETMIFDQGGGGSELDEWQERYVSREQALCGHAYAVELVRAALEREGSRC